MGRETMTRSGLFITKTLSAIVVVGALAAIHTAPAAAQTATDLDCKDCIKSKHIKDGKIKAKDLKDAAVEKDKIADGAVDSSKIEDSSVANVDLGGDAVTGDKIADGTVGSADVQDGSLTGADVQNGSLSVLELSDAAGGDFTDTFPSPVELSGNFILIESIEITAPALGGVIAYASGFIDFNGSSPSTIVHCQLTTGTTIDFSGPPRIAERADASARAESAFALTRGFSVSGGSTIINLVCQDPDGQLGSDAEVKGVAMTAIYVPTRY